MPVNTKPGHGPKDETMMKQLKLNDIWNMKGYKGIYMDSDGHTQAGHQWIRFGRRLRRDPKFHTASYVAMTEKGFAETFGAEPVGEIQLPKGFRAAMAMCDHVSERSDVSEFRFGFDLEGGWQCVYVDESMWYENGPGSIYEWRTVSRETMDDVFQMFRIFDTITMYRTKDGRYAFKLADLDDGLVLLSVKAWQPTEASVKRIEANGYSIAV